MLTRTRIPTLLLSLGSLALAAPGLAQTDFIAFETGPVRPLVLSPNGSVLVAANTPDNHLEVFSVGSRGITELASVPVGLEPCAVAIDGMGRAWVVNHLSDSVSIVNLTTLTVERTLLVGDEPRDIVITDHDGPGGDNPRAFITTAHRGQQRTDPSLNGVPGSGDPQLTTASVGRADVWVFDVVDPGAAFGGTPLKIVELFGDTPRALAVSNDGGTVYAAVFHSGNRTAVVPEGMVPDGFETQDCQPANDCNGDGVTSPNGLSSGRLPGGNPGPGADHNGDPAPEVGLVVQYDEQSGEWRDEDGRNWSNGIRFTLPDYDVFEIDADTLNENTLARSSHVGTILFNMAVNPSNDKLYVSNTEAQNLTRFEGPGITGGSTVQGNLHHARITVIDNGTVTPRHLNSHINYATLPAPAGTKDHSLATPLQMVVSGDGATLYVAAFGSSKVGVIPTADLENGSFDPTTQSASYLPVSGGGPSGLALDESHQILYVLTRFNNSVAAIDLMTGTEISSHPLHNPEPDFVVDGRPFLYDAFGTSSNGEASCSSCHVFGDFDSLSWDLGNPDDDVKTNTQTINLAATLVFQPFPGLNGTGVTTHLHPMKGPMSTQTLRGMATSGHLHWRGDRGSGFCGTDAAGGTDTELSFKNFIVAFAGLVGSDQAIAPADCNGFMQQFTDFMLEVALPPNPVRALDNSLTPAQDAGREFYLGNVGPDSGDGDGHRSDGTNDQFGFTLGFTCEGCHRLDASQGFFGTGGQASFENETQIMKIPHLRNAYQKVGMFGMANVPFNIAGLDNSHQGDQVRGTGFLHDGSTDTLFRFLSADVFSENFAGNNIGFFGPNDGEQQRLDMEQFVLAFDSDLAPIVGQQITLSSTNELDVLPRIQLLEQRAGASFTSAILGGSVTECDLVVQGLTANGRMGWIFRPGSTDYVSDWSADPDSPYTPAELRAVASQAGRELTFTCVPPGSGERVARDRDGDGAMNFDEVQAGTDPDNPGSVVGACNDTIDNDGDGFADLGDPGCGGNAALNIENPECSDGYDNDADGVTDFPAEPHCTSAADDMEKRPPSSCGLGAELVLVLAPLGMLAIRRRRGVPNP